LANQPDAAYLRLVLQIICELMTMLLQVSEVILLLALSGGAAPVASEMQSVEIPER
jgi:hypothetical protein